MLIDPFLVLMHSAFARVLDLWLTAHVSSLQVPLLYCGECRSLSSGAHCLAAILVAKKRHMKQNDTMPILRNLDAFVLN